MKRKIAGLLAFILSISNIIMPGIVHTSAEVAPIQYLHYTSFSKHPVSDGSTIYGDFIDEIDGKSKFGLLSSTNIASMTVDGDKVKYVGQGDFKMTFPEIPLTGSNKKFVVEFAVDSVKYPNWLCPMFFGATPCFMPSGSTSADRSDPAYLLDTESATYRLIIDDRLSGDKTISVYKNDVLIESGASECFVIPQNESRAVLGARFNCNNSTGTKYFTFDYALMYRLSEDMDFSVISSNSTEAVVQFSQPMDLSSLSNIKVDGENVASVTDYSAHTDTANTYKITFDEKAPGEHTISADESCIGLIDGKVMPTTDKTFRIEETLAYEITDKSGKTLSGLTSLMVNGGGTTPYIVSDTITEKGGGAFFENGSLYVNGGTDIGKLMVSSTDIGKRTDKLWIEFTLNTDNVQNTFVLNYGPNHKNSYNLMPNAQIGEKEKHFRVFLDNSNKIVKVYDGDTLRPAGEAFDADVFAENHIYMYFPGVRADSATSVSNLSIYAQGTESFLARKVTDMHGGSYLQFSKPIAYSESSATINKRQYKLVKAHDIAGYPNLYKIDDSKIPTGNYRAEVSVKSVDGDSAESITMDVSVGNDDVEFPETDEITFSYGDNSALYLAEGELSAQYNNSDTYDITAAIALALYDENGSMVSLSLKDNSEDPELETSLNIGNIEKGMYAKAMVWNMESLSPMCDAKTLRLNDQAVDTEFYPGFRKKAVVFSYDDGAIGADSHLVNIFESAGIRGTFNLLGRRFNQGSYNASALNVYKNQEVANHSFDHRDYRKKDDSGNYLVSDEEAIADIKNGRETIESVLGGEVLGFVWPYNNPNRQVLNDYLIETGVKYVRVVTETGEFGIPSDWMNWAFTNHHDAIPKIKERFFEEKNTGSLKLLSLWGHAYEFDTNDNWDMITDFVDELSYHKEIWIPTCMELRDYIEAKRNLIITENTIMNPSESISVYVMINNKQVIIGPNETVSYDSEQK